jgi:hypothetical protein
VKCCTTIASSALLFIVSSEYELNIVGMGYPVQIFASL